MQRVFAISVAFGIGLIAVGCSKANNSAQGETRPEWELTLTNKCADSSSDCTAAQGFSVLAGGKFRFGSGPTAATRKMDAEDYSAIEQIVSLKLAPSQIASASANNCEDQSPNTVGDSITIARRAAPREIAKATEDKFCYQTKSQDDALELHQKLQELAEKYACVDASEAVNDIAPSVNFCTTDADCSYVTADLEVVTPDAKQLVEIDSCTLVKPLQSANLNRFSAKQDQLKEALGHAQSVCGQSFIRNNCVPQYFMSENAPKCAQNRCVMHPANQVIQQSL